MKHKTKKKCSNTIFQFVHFPVKLSKLNKTFNEISKNDNIRFSWLKTKYGKDAIEACSFHLNIVSKNTFAKLLSQTNIPRYVLQRSFIRLIKKNRHDLIIILLNRGSELYADLSLNSLDTDRFKEIYTRAGSFNTFFQLFNPNGHAAIDENSEALKLLVTENNFDLNYCKWNSHTGVSNLKVCEGYKHFLTVIQSKGISLIKEMLQYGVIPYISESSPVEIPSVPFDPFNAIDQHSHVNVGSDRELAPIWITSIFPSDLHPYLTKTCDAIVLATKLKSAEIVKILLEFDLERWNSNHGKKVLKDCLQLAVDIDWKVGEKLINDYSGNHEKPSKSEAALRKMLLDACKCACFDDVKSLLEEGATFMIDGNFRHLSWFVFINLGGKLYVISLLQTMSR